MPIGYIGSKRDPYVRLVRAYVSELDGLVVPEGPPRRAMSASAPEALAELRSWMDRLLGEVVARRMMPSYFLGLAETTLFGFGSVLYAAGAPHPTWRRWFALRAIAHRLLGSWSQGVILGAIAGEWAFVDAIDGTGEKLDVASTHLWRMLGKRPQHDYVPSPDDGKWGDGWAALSVAALAKDPPRIDRALALLVDEALELDPQVTADAYDVYRGGGDARSLCPWGWSAVSESGQVCAAAAVLRRTGLAPSDRIGAARLRYLEPGLAVGDSWLGAQRFVPRE